MSGSVIQLGNACEPEALVRRLDKNPRDRIAYRALAQPETARAEFARIDKLVADSKSPPPPASAALKVVNR